MENSKAKGRQQLVLLILFFVAPIVLAIIVYNNMPAGGTGKTKNHGELVTPARPLVDVNLIKESGEEYKFSDMKKTWIMVYIGESECDKECENNLFKMRQSRLAQRGEHLRIKRLYISTSGKAKASLVNVLKQNPGLEVVHGTDAAIKKVLQQFTLENKSATKTAKRLYLVDPLGNLMMSYENGYDAIGLIEDMTLLLKVSRIG